MSYSFSVSAATKAEAKQKIAQQFDGVVEHQPIHAADRASAQAASEAFVDALLDPDASEQVNVWVYGSVSWRGEKDITNASVKVEASIVAKA